MVFSFDKFYKFSMMKVDKIKMILSGAIFADSKINDFASFPQFSQMSSACRCYLVEYDNGIWSWKFFWSKPNEYGDDGNFITKVMKEDPPRNGDRYFNDAKDKDQLMYDTTLTLTSTIMQDGGQSFMYRQQFADWIGAFAGSLGPTDPKSVPPGWINLFERNAPS